MIDLIAGHGLALGLEGRIEALGAVRKDVLEAMACVRGLPRIEDLPILDRVIVRLDALLDYLKILAALPTPDRGRALLRGSGTRAKIIFQLHEASDWVGSSTLRRDLGISRQALHQALDALRGAGLVSSELGAEQSFHLLTPVGRRLWEEMVPPQPPPPIRYTNGMINAAIRLQQGRGGGAPAQLQS